MNSPTTRPASESEAWNSVLLYPAMTTINKYIHKYTKKLIAKLRLKLLVKIGS